ncbi:MAG: hypothetical protein ACI89L_002113 [Phycisphaerales bacterium]
MTNRNEQFVCFTAVLAVAVPALLWFWVVGGLRSSVATDEMAISEMRLALSRYTEAQGRPTSEADLVQADRIRTTREEIEGVMGRGPSVSEVYRGVEQAGAATGLTVSRIEPSKDSERSKYEGPLEEYTIWVESRSYRIKVEGPAEDLSAFLDGLGETLGNIAIREVRAQYTGTPGRARSVSASVTLESLSLAPVQTTGGGK